MKNELQWTENSGVWTAQLGEFRYLALETKHDFYTLSITWNKHTVVDSVSTWTLSSVKLQAQSHANAIAAEIEKAVGKLQYQRDDLVLCLARCADTMEGDSYTIPNDQGGTKVVYWTERLRAHETMARQIITGFAELENKSYADFVEGCRVRFSKQLDNAKVENKL